MSFDRDSVFRPEILRQSGAMRRLVREQSLRAEDLVLPVFLNETHSGSRELTSLPGVHQWSVSGALRFVEEAYAAGVRSFILFGVVDSSRKTPDGSAAWDPKGPVPQALQQFKSALGDVNLFADACFCEYTDHGHCGPLENISSLSAGVVEASSVRRHRAQTLQGLQRMAQVYAEAGAQVIAPSGMVDGMVRHVRQGLDEAGWDRVAICSYAVKYASAFYGPFREAAENAPRYGDRRTYQMDSANLREALREAELDENEGADLLLVKPGMPCLDVIRAVRERSHVPVGAYQVSGEYAMMKAAAAQGWVSEDAVFSESLLAFKRAGAQFVITYWAVRAATLIREGQL